MNSSRTKPETPTAAIAATSRALQGPTRRSFRRELFVLVAGAIVLSAMALAFFLYSLREQNLRGAEKLVESFAQVLAEETTRIFQTVDQRLELAASRLPAHPSGDKEAQDRALIQNEIRGLSFVKALTVLDRNGTVRLSSEAGKVGVDLSDRAYFQEQKHAPSGFRIGPPLQSRTTREWLISAARPRPPVGGEFSGLLVAALDPFYFDNLWKNVDLGPGASIALFNRNGTLMMRSPFDEQVMGRTFPDLPVFKLPLDRVPSGFFVNPSVFDGTYRLFGYQVLPEHPDLVLVVGQSYEFVLAPWRQFAKIAISVWAVASLSVVILGAFLNAAWKQRTHVERQVQNLAQRLTLATDAASIGVWDCDLERDVWSATPTYFNMLGYPPGDGIGRGEQWLELVHPDDRPVLVLLLEAAVTGSDQLHQVEVRLLHADGSYRWARAIGRVLDRDSNGRPVRLLGVVMDITDAKHAEATLQRSMTEKEGLLKEIHHRVKNNLQVISSLLRLETSRSSETGTRTVLLDMQGRIRSMALLHETLYRTQEFGRVEIASYLQKLTAQLLRAHSAEPGKVKLSVELEPVQLEIDRAVPCGLIVNELMSNCFKHAFPLGESGEVRLILKVDEAGLVLLRVSDNGAGLPDNFHERRRESLGLQLVGDLSRQLGGKFEVGPGPAAVFSVVFPIKNRLRLGSPHDPGSPATDEAPEEAARG